MVNNDEHMDDDLDAIIEMDADELEQEQAAADADKSEGDEKPEDKPEEKKPDEQAKPDEKPAEDEAPAETPAADEGKPAEVPEKPETPAPLTAEQVREIMSEVRTEERNSGKQLEQTEAEILKAYYPDGLTNTLIDKSTGREIKTPQDVVELSNGQMTTEEAAQWLVNEQFRLDRENAEIRRSARELAETNINFERGSKTVLQRYGETVFKEYPHLQERVYKQYMNLVKYDADKGVILSAPDIEEFYDTMLEPYRLAYEYKTRQSAVAPTEPAPEQKPAEPPKPTADDRMDISGDSGSGAGGKHEADPNNPDESLSELFGE